MRKQGKLPPVVPAQQELEGKPRKQPKISSWRDWFVKTESGAMVVGAGPLLEGATPRRKVSTDTAEVKLLKDKFKALVYGRNKDPATLLFKKFDPDGDGELSFPEFQVSRHDIAGIWVAFSSSGLHSSQDASDTVADRVGEQRADALCARQGRGRGLGVRSPQL